MNKMIFEEVKNIIQEISPVDCQEVPITGNTNLFEDLMINSVNFILLISKIEEKFEATFDFEDTGFLNINDINSLITFVDKYVSAKEIVSE